MTTSVRLLLILCAAMLAMPAVCQRDPGVTTAPTNAQRGNTSTSPSNTDVWGSNPQPLDGAVLDPSVIRRREEARKLDRKKRMVDSANRLLVLSQQLQTDLKGREATPEDQKKLDEIAKLARQVKDQMRN